MMQPLTDDDEELDLLLRQQGPDFDPIWADLQEAMDSERTVNAQILDSIEGGLLAYVGVLGFIPASHLENGRSRNRDQYIGKSLPVRVLTIDGASSKVILSHRLATEEEREQRKQETIATLALGQTRTGTVRRIADFGIFVDLGGIDGLLPTTAPLPENIQLWQEIQVVVRAIDLDRGRITLDWP